MQLSGQRVLVTGACGTVGRELVHQLIANHRVRSLVGVDNNETELCFLEQRHAQDSRAAFLLADVRDRDKLTTLMQGIDLVFHTAAFKHVSFCERSPFEAVQTNVIGVQNIIQAAIAQHVPRVIFTSSDKAVNPTSVMGTSKLMGERLMTAANSQLRSGGQIFAATRFGNVLGSRGSVIPIFRRQIRRGGPVTLTDPEMTRFVMSIRQAVALVIESAAIACGGEVFVTKMPAIRIQDLAAVMIAELAPRYGYRPADIRVEEVGMKAGEKMYEELLSQEETRRTLELERYFAILPAFADLYRDIEYQYAGVVSRRISRAYNSASSPCLSKAELSAFLKAHGLLEQTDEGDACAS